MCSDMRYLHRAMRGESAGHPRQLRASLFGPGADLLGMQLFAIGMSLQSVLGFIDQPLALSRVSGAIDGLDSTIRTVREVIYGRRTTAEDRTPVASIVDVIARATPATRNVLLLLIILPFWTSPS